MSQVAHPQPTRQLSRPLLFALVRWDDLFRDLEAQLDVAGTAHEAAEIADRTRREQARLRLVDRLRAAIGVEVGMSVHGLGSVTGRVAEVGADWLLIVESTGRDLLLQQAAILGITGLGLQSAEPGSEGRVAARLDLRYALRAIARDRSPVTLVLVDGSQLTGTIDRTGADFLELAEHSLGDARRATAVRTIRTVPLEALAGVRTT
jgi:hypothetical protein